ncbi:hypothetical protein BDR26DRAFT_894934 [Obelidium mucronatum]|nr:hypothetical protein BDR26DRAFT_894934 [Obelidium mucronatum]
MALIDVKLTTFKSLWLFVAAMERISSKLETPMKLTLLSNKETAKLEDIFEHPNLKYEARKGSITFKFHTGNMVEVIASKSSGKYRLQGNSFDTFGVPFSDLNQRLSRFFERDDVAFELVIKDSFPTSEFSCLLNLYRNLSLTLDRYQDSIVTLKELGNRIQATIIIFCGNKAANAGLIVNGYDNWLEGKVDPLFKYLDGSQTHDSTNLALHLSNILAK